MRFRIRIDASVAVLLAVLLGQADTVWAGFLSGLALALFTLYRWRPVNSIPTPDTLLGFTVGPIVLTVLAEMTVAEVLRQDVVVGLWGILAAITTLAAILATSHFATRAKFKPA